ncbi:hypothetical protein BCR33DRAFT_488139 [Rhizoclosmatium globosum]|uniref:Uncharacterized protein n=1 Tax=Rhizoclosmatium globosum TaxID=329046 RepID=A0A1Y2BMR9_9FUNG|nr:hypothetical protein BCR33DRAFT_488139 [Rhizoclosmatium globosum]|eukprot:ORY36054.1 hypothetical protein BCR33DRAFT_488139 [Rhizoclosmatium globosum]
MSVAVKSNSESLKLEASVDASETGGWLQAETRADALKRDRFQLRGERGKGLTARCVSVTLHNTPISRMEPPDFDRNRFVIASRSNRMVGRSGAARLVRWCERCSLVNDFFSCPSVHGCPSTQRIYFISVLLPHRLNNEMRDASLNHTLNICA